MKTLLLIFILAAFGASETVKATEYPTLVEVHKDSWPFFDSIVRHGDTIVATISRDPERSEGWHVYCEGDSPHSAIPGRKLVFHDRTAIQFATHMGSFTAVARLSPQPAGLLIKNEYRKGSVSDEYVTDRNFLEAQNPVLMSLNARTNCESPLVEVRTNKLTQAPMGNIAHPAYSLPPFFEVWVGRIREQFNHFLLVVVSGKGALLVPTFKSIIPNPPQSDFTLAIDLSAIERIVPMEASTE
jgi:hypothetical protein